MGGGAEGRAAGGLWALGLWLGQGHMAGDSTSSGNLLLPSIFDEAHFGLAVDLKMSAP